MRVPLLGGFYKARSIISSAQSCINLFPEKNPGDSPEPVTHYPTPGLTLLAAGPSANPVRCLYRASNGELFTVIGTTVYYVNSAFALTSLGTIGTSTTPVSMVDNGLAVVVVDGSANGYAIDLAAHTFGSIPPTNFYGADRVDFVDTYLLFNRPETNQWYISLASATYAMLTGGSAFDALDIAAKTGWPDNIATLMVMHREVWTLGELKSEIWYNSGAADFTFEIMPGAFVEHGTVAKYSIAAHDLSIYWLGQDLQGQAIVLRGSGYQALRISTHAIENEIASYEDISDAIGYTYQEEGHLFYVLIFPSADKTWVFDQTSELWHQRAWTDSNGNLHRHRSNCCANAYGKIVVGDWQNGNLYEMSLDAYTDNGDPISRIRSFPHLVNESDRVFYYSFTADMEVGTDSTTTPADPPVVSLAWSDDRGKTYGNKIEQSLGAGGQYKTSIQWNRLGMARDRVFELSWSAATKTALSGAYITISSAGT